MSPPAATAAARARHADAPPLRLPPAPRRVSGPSRHPRASAAPVVAPSLVVALIDHPWLERLVRGRAWIAIVATALLGIVGMQVALLRLGAQIGNETTAVNALTAQNETARTENAVLEAGHRLTSTARDLGMVYPAPGALTYLAVNSGDALRAVHEMTAPSSAALAAAAADAHHIAAAQPPAQAVTTAASPATTVSPATGATAATGVTPATGATSVTGATSATGSTPASGASTTSGASPTTTSTTPSTTAAGTPATGAAAPTSMTPAGTTATTPPAGTTTPTVTTPATTTGTAVTTAAGGATPGA